MGALMLRAERCLNCGGPMRFGLRIVARYCKPSCRTLAYRIRKRTGGPAAKQNQATPKWADGKPQVVGSALALLADLQARIVSVARQLQKEDLGSRPPKLAAEPDPPPAAREPSHGRSENSAPEELAARPSLQDLVTSLGHAEAALAAVREQMARFARRTDSYSGEEEPLRALVIPPKQHSADARVPAHDPTSAHPSETSRRTEAPIRDSPPLHHAESGLPGGVSVKDTQRVDSVLERALVKVSSSDSQPVGQVEDLICAVVPPNSTHLGIPTAKSPRSALPTKDPKPSDYVGKLLHGIAPAKDPQPQDHVDKLLRAADQAANPRRGNHIERLERAETSSNTPPLARPFQKRPSRPCTETKPTQAEPTESRRPLGSAIPAPTRPPSPAPRSTATQALGANSQRDAASSSRYKSTDSPAHPVAAKTAPPNARAAAAPLTSLHGGSIADARAVEQIGERQSDPRATFIDPRVQPSESTGAAASKGKERSGAEPNQPGPPWHLQPREKRKKTPDYVSSLLQEHQGEEDSDEPKTRDYLGPLLQRYIDGEE